MPSLFARLRGRIYNTANSHPATQAASLPRLLPKANHTYLWTLVLLMFVFPITSILVELFGFNSPAAVVFLVGKWFVFWAVGVRLFVAGLRQALNPQFTAEEIFGINSKEPLVVVQELGFANISIGLGGLISVFASPRVLPASVAGACSMDWRASST